MLPWTHVSQQVAQLACSLVSFVQKSDDDEVDGPFTFRRKPHIRYHMVSVCHHTDEAGVHFGWFTTMVMMSVYHNN